MTYDVKLGTHVLVTTTDEGAAHRIAEAFDADRDSLFQCEGLDLEVVETDRDAEPDEPAAPAITAEQAAIHHLSVPDVQDAIAAADEVDTVRHIRDAEELNPRSQGPRSGIIDSAEERIGELDGE